MVLLEVIRQLDTFGKIQRAKHKVGIPFPLFIGRMLESCSSTQIAESADVEMQWYPFSFYRSSSNFDPHHHITKANERKYKHKVDLEDFWANADDEFEVTKRMLSRLLVSMTRTLGTFPRTRSVRR